MIRRGDDRALSDMLGTILLLGITVTLVATLGMQLHSSVESTGSNDPGRLNVIASGERDATELTLLHVGGSAWDQGRLRIVVTAGAETLHDDSLGDAGTSWALGERVTVGPLSRPLAGGDRVVVDVIHRDGGGTLTTATFAAPQPVPATGSTSGFSVDVTFDNDDSFVSVLTPGALVIKADVSHPEGRKAVASVTVDLKPVSGPGQVSLYDDGSHGDETAGDGVYTTYFLVPVNATLGRQTVTVTATDFHGARAEGEGQVLVRDEELRFNTAVIQDAGIRIMSYEGGSSDKVTVHLKVKLHETPYRMDDGTRWRLDEVRMIFDPFKPGNSEQSVALDDQQEPRGEGDWSCFDSGNRVKVFRAENATINQYSQSRDPFRYFLELEWTKISGSGSDSFTENVDSEVRDEYLILERTHDVEVVHNGNWPSSFDDCSN